MKHQRGECEALRLLRQLVEGDDQQMARALAAARPFLRRMRGPAYCGRTAGCKITRQQLRTIAELDGQHWTQQAIADRLGIKRASVHYHLRPSAPMIEALLETNQAA